MGNALLKDGDPFENTWDTYVTKLEEFRRLKIQKLSDQHKWLEKLKGRLAEQELLHDVTKEFVEK